MSSKTPQNGLTSTVFFPLLKLVLCLFFNKQPIALSWRHSGNEDALPAFAKWRTEILIHLVMQDSFGPFFHGIETLCILNAYKTTKLQLWFHGVFHEKVSICSHDKCAITLFLSFRLLYWPPLQAKCATIIVIYIYVLWCVFDQVFVVDLFSLLH